jgi:myo-inositol 2-dehydrogenase/D-chiro-inositol 1-dehydrogenase
VTDSAPIRVGVLGTGRIGRMHAELLARRVDGLALSAVFDKDTAVAADVARRLGVPAASTAEELMLRGDVDGIAICTSTESHVDLLEAAARIGKPVFVEKPLSLDLGEVERGLAAVGRAGLFLQVGFNRRFDPAHRSVHDAVARGSIGDVHLVRISSRDLAPPPPAYVRASGGIFLDMTGHDFDMARFLTGSEVEEVYARGEVRIDPAIEAAGDLDTVIVVLRHADGTLTAIDNSRQSVYGYDQRVEAFGSSGVAVSENPLVHTGLVRTADGARAPALPHFFLERYTASYLAEWAAFQHAIRSGDPPPVTGVDGRAALVIGLAARRSVAERRPVATADVGERAGGSPVA